MIAPDGAWRDRPDMHPEFTKRLRAAMVARSRFIEDLVIDQAARGVTLYVLLGAGLDTFAQRRADVASELQVYEIDQPDTLTWKRRRLEELGFGIPDWLHFVSVDFETSSWWDELLNAGFDRQKAGLIASTSVSLYLTTEAISSIFSRVAALARGSVLAMTFYLPMDSLDEADKPLQRIAEKGAGRRIRPSSAFSPRMRWRSWHGSLDLSIWNWCPQPISRIAISRGW